jgi:hypothetical protein
MLRALRYTRAALLVFGLGVALGFVIVVGEFARFRWAASLVMALGLVALPLALIADGKALALRAWFAARLPRGRKKKPFPKTRTKARPAASRRRAPVRVARGRRA